MWDPCCGGTSPEVASLHPTVMNHGLPFYLGAGQLQTRTVLQIIRKSGSRDSLRNANLAASSSPNGKFDVIYRRDCVDSHPVHMRKETLKASAEYAFGPLDFYSFDLEVGGHCENRRTKQKGRIKQINANQVVVEYNSNGTETLDVDQIKPLEMLVLRGSDIRDTGWFVHGPLDMEDMDMDVQFMNQACICCTGIDNHYVVGHKSKACVAIIGSECYMRFNPHKNAEIAKLKANSKKRKAGHVCTQCDKTLNDLRTRVQKAGFCSFQCQRMASQVCYACQQKGHFRAKCPLRKVRQQAMLAVDVPTGNAVLTQRQATVTAAVVAGAPPPQAIVGEEWRKKAEQNRLAAIAKRAKKAAQGPPASYAGAPPPQAIVGEEWRKKAEQNRLAAIAKRAKKAAQGPPFSYS